LRKILLIREASPGTDVRPSAQTLSSDSFKVCSKLVTLLKGVSEMIFIVMLARLVANRQNQE